MGGAVSLSHKYAYVSQTFAKLHAATHSCNLSGNSWGKVLTFGKCINAASVLIGICIYIRTFMHTNIQSEQKNKSWR